jgi:hypothetical protein
MDDDLRNAFATLSAQVADCAGDARHAAEQARGAAHETYKLGARMEGLEGDVRQLKTAVFGSNPPPAPVPVVKRITHSEGELAELTGRLMTVTADMTAVRALNEEQNAKLDEHRQMLLANTTDTIAIRREVVDGIKGFWKRHPKLENALVALIFTIIGVATAWVAARGGRV